MFPEDVGGGFLAGAAIRGHAEFCLQVLEVANAGLRGFADLFVGNGVADADVHVFNTSLLTSI